MVQDGSEDWRPLSSCHWQLQ